MSLPPSVLGVADHTGWAAAVFPALATPVPWLGRVPVHDVLQIALTLVLGALGLHQVARIGRERLLVTWYPDRESATREATPYERRGAAAYLLGCAFLGALVGIARAHARWEWIELGAFGVVAFVFYGLLLAAIADRLRAPRARSLPLGTETES